MNAWFLFLPFASALRLYTALLKSLFSAALEREPDHACEVLSNRASCLLKLDRLAECIADCTKALAHAGMFNERPQAQAVGRQDLLRLRLHVKRGTAYFRCKEYQKALDDYRSIPSSLRKEATIIL